VKVDIELFGQLLPGVERHQTLTLQGATTVRDVALRLGLNMEEVGLITINGVQSEEQDAIPPDCRLCFFPPMSGG
jgi:Mg2+/Co2+ transporter CorB